MKLESLIVIKTLLENEIASKDRAAKMCFDMFRDLFELEKWEVSELTPEWKSKRDSELKIYRSLLDEADAARRALDDLMDRNWN